LVELMVTLAVLAILLAAAVPSFADFFDKYRLRGAVDDVVSVISDARAESVKSGRDVRVDFAGTASAWCVAANPADAPTGGAAIGSPDDCDCSTGTCNSMPDGHVLEVSIGKHKGITASAATLAEAFNFDSKLGLVDPLTQHTATFTSPSGKYSMDVTVNPLGQASACATGPAIAGVPSC
jgi:type IV fimbrial biogenesis protein FimT